MTSSETLHDNAASIRTVLAVVSSRHTDPRKAPEYAKDAARILASGIHRSGQMVAEGIKWAKRHYVSASGRDRSDMRSVLIRLY